MSQITEKNRIEYLDIARGLAIILMICFHVLGETVLVFHHFVACMIIEIFVFISGYFFKGFNLKKNIIKLYLPFALTLCGVRLFWYIKDFGHFPFNIKHTLYQILSGITIDSFWEGQSVFVGIIWFLPCLMAIRIIYALINKITKNDYILKTVIVMSLTLFGMFLGKYATKTFWSVDIALTMTSFFYLGELARQHENGLQKIYRKWYTLPLAFILWYIMMRIFDYSELPFRKYPYGPVFILVSLFALYSIIEAAYLIQKTKYISSVLKTFGKYSFWILVMHVFDKSCIVYPKDINIFLLALIEIAIASIPVVIIKFIELFKGAYVEENNQ